ncbi:hypothetical protein GH820_10015 [Bacillus thuringiensis]|nr:hypothetical protein [Bacillus thuringiensis]
MCSNVFLCKKRRQN